MKVWFHIISAWLLILGSSILIADLLDCTQQCHIGGNLHAISAGVGSFLVLLAVAFEFPLRLKDAFETLKPVADEVKSLK